MGNLRKLEVRLGQNLEDKLNQKLGYREYAVIPPSGVSIEPRPLVEQIDLNRVSSTLATSLIQSAQGESGLDAGIPNALYKVHLSRNFSYEEFTQGGTWQIQRDDWQDPTSCYIAHHRETDARIELILGVLKFV